MDDKQKCFLRELHKLFDMYDIDSMMICDNRIVFEYGNNSLSCESYIRRPNSDTAYFSNIMSQSELFIIDIN